MPRVARPGHTLIESNTMPEVNVTELERAAKKEGWPDGLVRRALAFVLLASALKLFDVPNTETGIILLVTLLCAPILWMVVRRRLGYPALSHWRQQEKAMREAERSRAAEADRS